MSSVINQVDILKCVPGVSKIVALNPSGQKQVFKCNLKNEPIVLKFVHIETNGGNGRQVDDAALARILREVKLINSLSSPFLPEACEVSPDYYKKGNEVFYYYGEKCVDGEPLRDVLRTGNLDQAQGILLMENITNAIKTLWENNQIIHRDIKPENIIYNQSAGVFVLIDAGLALALSEASITPTGYIVGTPIYMSPEQVQGKKRDLDFRSDLYSLGVVLYEGVAGYHPYHQPGMVLSEILKAVLNTQPKKLKGNLPNFADDFLGLIDVLLAKRPHLRINSCDKLLSKLSQF